MTALNAEAVQSVLASVPRPVWIVTSAQENCRGGLVATWVMQASLNPQEPLMMLGLARNHYTTSLVAESRSLGLHLIGAAQIDLVWRFGITSGRDGDKLAGLAIVAGCGTAPLLADCLAWLDCRVVAQYDGGDRSYFWAEVLAGSRILQGQPLRENEVFEKANAEQKAQLKAGLVADLALQQPLRRQWLREMSRKA